MQINLKVPDIFCISLFTTLPDGLGVWRSHADVKGAVLGIGPITVAPGDRLVDGFCGETTKGKRSGLGIP